MSYSGTIATSYVLSTSTKSPRAQKSSLRKFIAASGCRHGLYPKASPPPAFRFSSSSTTPSSCTLAALETSLAWGKLVSGLGRGTSAVSADMAQRVIRTLTSQLRPLPITAGCTRRSTEEQLVTMQGAAFHTLREIHCVCPDQRYPAGRTDNIRAYTPCGSGAGDVTVTNTISESLDLQPNLPIQRFSDPSPPAPRPFPSGDQLDNAPGSPYEPTMRNPNQDSAGQTIG